MIKFAVLALCVAAVAASGYEKARSHLQVEKYTPSGVSKYEVHQVHPKYVGGHDGGYGGYGGGYGKFVGGQAKVYVQAHGSGGHRHGGHGGGHGGYGGGDDGHGGGHGGNTRYSYRYRADVGHGYGGYGH